MYWGGVDWDLETIFLWNTSGAARTFDVPLIEQGDADTQRTWYASRLVAEELPIAYEEVMRR